MGIGRLSLDKRGGKKGSLEFIGGTSGSTYHGGGSIRTLARGQMPLRADTVNGDSGCNPGFYVTDHGLGFCVGGCVEAVGALVRSVQEMRPVRDQEGTVLGLKKSVGGNVLTCSR